ncbi:protein C1orf43 homolog [Episyrphus balteatus]|uniref:protein C1orf43 homolog n=1 Tax=Episyrphus balteatus TaxID=286459 RepID=UPI00248637DE|nr:protein C1orf43 homolog [Episyrphus balteatus]XP_055856543.1 protein C1orf43 homolog [Episyrphus balteatus]XP_055856544.1 protein C1orf43 homolog [Episyrphus balteatus]
MDTIRVNKLGNGQQQITTKMEQLSGVMIIIIIGGGVLTFVMLFIFAKRQIMRFTLRSRRGPHVPVGNDAKKGIRREIERRLDCIQKIAHEPKLLWDDDKYILKPDQPLPPYYYRMKAVDDIKILEKEIARCDGSVRHPYDSLRAFLLTTLASTSLNGSGQRLIHQFCDMYEHARHDPNDFGSEEYEAYHRLLLKLLDAAKQLKSFSNSRKTSPSRTPKKQTKMHSLLDPSRLRPPPLNTDPNSPVVVGGSELSGQHSKVNLTLGLQSHHIQDQDQERENVRNRIKNVPTSGSGSGGDENEILSVSVSTYHDNSSSVV